MGSGAQHKCSALDYGDDLMDARYCQNQFSTMLQHIASEGNEKINMDSYDACVLYLNTCIEYLVFFFFPIPAFCHLSPWEAATVAPAVMFLLLIREVWIELLTPNFDPRLAPAVVGFGDVY